MSKHDIDDLKHKADDMLEEGKKKIKETAAKVGATATDRFDDLSDIAEEEFARIYGESETKLEAVVGFVKNRPLLSLGIAAFLGFVVTRIFRSRD